jgi:periplasmic divalent cation tolerance protein
MKEIVILSTADSIETASRIARILIENGDAACVNILPGLRSIYRWQGKVCDDSELLMVIKTTEAHFEAVRLQIRALHPYELPEAIALPIIAGDEEYLRWISASVAS